VDACGEENLTDRGRGRVEDPLLDDHTAHITDHRRPDASDLKNREELIIQSQTNTFKDFISKTS